MKINTIPHNKTTFGMAVITPAAEKEKVRDYLQRHITTEKEVIKLNMYIEEQKNNPIDIYIATTEKSRTQNEKFKAIVGGREYISKNPIKAIRKAISSANSFYAEKLVNEAKCAGKHMIIAKLLK